MSQAFPQMLLVLLGVIVWRGVVVAGQCAFTQSVEPGSAYTVQSPGFPDERYVPGSSCTWTAYTTPGAKMVIDCEYLDIPSRGTVCIDYLRVKAGASSKDYCGTEPFIHVSPNNRIVMSLSSQRMSWGGRFSCSVGAAPGSSPPPGGDCDCGWSFRPRIVGGTETGVNEFPLMAGLVSGSEKRLICGAAIIGSSTVLTAAHCVTGRNTSDLGVLVGDHDISTGTETSSAALIRVSRVAVHPMYDATSQANDIAVLRLSSPLNFGPRVGPACLPFRQQGDFTGQQLIALGWGTTDFGGSTSDTLQKVTVDSVGMARCLMAYPTKAQIETQICTFARGKDACQYDSGGPVLWLNPTTNRFVLAGLISYGRGCGGNFPSVNTRVSSFLNFIVSQSPDEKYCVK